MREDAKAHSAAVRNGWYDEVCTHMQWGRKPNNYWTKERCHEEALKYETRTDFIRGAKSAYSISRNNRWLDDICGHMLRVGDSHHRFVYELADHDESAVYIGLTCHPKKRLKEHKVTPKGIIKRFGKDYKFKMTVLTESLPVMEAAEKEQSFIDDYRKMGYNVLNQAKAGALGNIEIKWTVSLCRDEALKYASRTAFLKGSHRAYDAALRNGWMDEVCSHMERKIKPMGYWSKENILAEAKKYKTQSEFRRHAPGCFTRCQILGLMEEACSHMIVQKKSPKGYWDIKENCRREAVNHNRRVDFSRAQSSAYKSSVAKGWIDEFFPREAA